MYIDVKQDLKKAKNKHALLGLIITLLGGCQVIRVAVIIEAYTTGRKMQPANELTRTYISMVTNPRIGISSALLKSLSDFQCVSKAGFPLPPPKSIFHLRPVDLLLHVDIYLA